MPEDRARPTVPTTATFTAMIAVGPDPVELARTHDLLSALYFHEPLVSHVVIVDDAAAPRDLAAALPPAPATCRVRVVTSPRNGRGEPRNGGGCVVMTFGFFAASEGETGAFVLKLDTDALIVGPFYKKLKAVIDAEPLAGVIGACTVSPTGEARDDRHHRRVFDNAGKLWLVPKERKMVGRRFRSYPTTRRHWKLWRVVRRARRAGCTLGENVSGGAYALTAEAIRRMKASGLLGDYFLWVDTLATEDAVLPLYAKMLGLKLVDFVGRDQTFGIVYKGLPAPPEEIVSRGYGVIHSIKNDEQWSEAAIRSFFAARRGGSKNSAAGDLAASGHPQG
jgi:hypothetical protein